MLIVGESAGIGIHVSLELGVLVCLGSVWGCFVFLDLAHCHVGGVCLLGDCESENPAFPSSYHYLVDYDPVNSLAAG